MHNLAVLVDDHARRDERADQLLVQFAERIRWRRALRDDGQRGQARHHRWRTTGDRRWRSWSGPALKNPVTLVDHGEELGCRIYGLGAAQQQEALRSQRKMKGLDDLFLHLAI